MEVSVEALRSLVDAIAEAELGRNVFADGLAAALSLRGEPVLSTMLHQARLRAAANTLPTDLSSLKKAARAPRKPRAKR